MQYFSEINLMLQNSLKLYFFLLLNVVLYVFPMESVLGIRSLFPACDSEIGVELRKCSKHVNCNVICENAVVSEINVKLQNNFKISNSAFYCRTGARSSAGQRVAPFLKKGFN